MNKRERAPNYSAEEIRRLLNILQSYKNIIESKKTDAVTWRQKQEAWQRIAANFNSDNLVHRSVDSLKKLYENKKKEARKAVSYDKYPPTGGGPHKPPPHDPNEDLVLELIHPTTVRGMYNPFDGDSTQPEQINIIVEETPEEDTTLNEENIDVSTNVDWGDFQASHLRTPVNRKLKHKIKSTIAKSTSEAIDSTSNEVANLTGKSLIIDKSAPPCKDDESNDTPSASKWSSRRRPVASTLHTSHLSEKYTSLANLKTELARAQLDCVKQEIRQKMEEHELRKRALELDIEIKELQVKKLKQCLTMSGNLDIM